jgi:uncharacterized protein YndB with AHSA1/START domain
MSDNAEHLRVPAVRFQRTYPAPIEHIWPFLTECDRLTPWYGEYGIIEPREGGAVNFAGGHIRGVVSQWKPYWRLAYSWNVFNDGETTSAYPESWLTIELEPGGESVTLTLTHLPVLERFEKQNAMGWHTFLDMLAAAVRGDPVEPRRAYMERNAKLYGVDLERLER